MTQKVSIPFVSKLILSTEFTALISISILTFQVLLLGVTLLFCLYEHFQRVGDTKCILPILSYSPNAGVCFFIGIIPGLLVIPILAGFLVWPVVLIWHTVSMVYRKKKFYPPFQVEIMSVQIMVAEWLIEKENTAKEKEYVKALLDVGGSDPKKMLPIEIIQIIAKIVESLQREENSRLRKRIRLKSQSHNYNSLLRINQPNRFLYSHSGYLILTSNSIYRAADFLDHDSYYAVFSKDVGIFTFLVILQLSLPYWLYRL